MNFGASRLGFWFIRNPFTITWDLQQTGIEPGCQDGIGGWYVSNQGLLVRYIVQDSFNCGGCNNNTQSGIATATINIPAGPNYYFSYNLNGVGEFQDTGYEQMTLTLNGGSYSNELLILATSQDLDQECTAFGPVVQNYIVPSPVILMNSTQYTFTLNFSTNDNLYHVDCFYECALSFTQAP